ncbi:MAG TPA: adenylate/guanylate cyclase domain-containing protein [Actinomycetota bacterium]
MITCPSCGEQNPDRARFCLACGTSLSAEPPVTSEERKVVSILFVDLVGFTAASEAADPEDVRARLRPYHATLKREIERFDGTVEKFIGDAVMAVFGAPVAHEDDAERAVRAALRIIDAIPELNEEHPGLDLAVRAAVNTGEAVVALGARPERGEGLVAGDVVNTASRLQGAAPVGGVVVGEATHRATREVFRFEQLPPVAVKGKTGPVALWRALEATGRYGVDVERPRTPFVGRGEDLGLLQQTLLRSVRDPGVQLVTITGEPGVGKTRLVAEFQAWVDDLPELVTWRQGRCLPYGDGVTFWALGEVVKSHAGILESDGPAEAAQKLAESVALLADEPDREWLRARLAPLIGLEDAGAPSSARSESFAAWRAFLEQVAATGPLVLVLEDLHWADPAMLEFVDDLVEWSSGVPLTVVCTARPELYEVHAGWGGGKRNSVTLSLTPLSGDDTSRLISSLLDQAVLPAETQSLLLERAGGNPLYAEEFVRMLVDRGILRRRGQAWTLVADEPVPVPDTVQSIIAARLDTLPPDRKAMLQDASVVGKVFWSGAVAALGGREERDVREGLHDLARTELIRPARRSSVDGQAEYAFWHAIVRDVTYGQLPRPARVRRHRAAAAWIESMAGERVGDFAELLAHHYRVALDLARAAGRTPGSEIRDLERALHRILLLAAERTMPLDQGRAAEFASAAVQLAPEAERGPSLALLAKLLMRRGEFRESAQISEQAIHLLEAAGDETGATDATLVWTTTLRQLGETARVSAVLADLIDALERRPPGRELVSAYTTSAGNFMLEGASARCLEYAEKAIELGERFGMTEMGTRALQFRGAARQELGDSEGGIANLREAVRISRELGLPEAPAAYVNFGDALWEYVGPAEALQAYTDAIDYAERRGLRGMATWAMGQTTWALFDLGEWDRIIEVTDAVVRRDNWTSQTSVLPIPFRVRVLALRGRLAEVSAEVPDMLDRARHIQDPQILVPALTAAAYVEDQLGHGEAALELMAEVEDRDLPAWGPDFWFEGIRVLVRGGAVARARALTDRIVIEMGPRIAGLKESFAASIAEGEDDPARALEHHRRASGIWETYDHVLERAHAFLGIGRSLLALGRAEEAVGSLRSGREIAVGLRAVRLVDETDRLLAEATALSS